MLSLSLSYSCSRSHCHSYDWLYDGGGGALYFYASAIRIQDDTIFDNNTAWRGGAIYSDIICVFTLIIEGKNISFINNSVIGKPVFITQI